MPSAPQQPVELTAQTLAQRRIERRQGFVEQQDARPDRHRAGQRDPLALAAGELVDAAVLQSRDIGQRHQFGDPRGAILLRDSADLKAIADIVRHAHVRKQRVGLKHHADIAPLDRHGGHVPAVEQHLSAGVGQFEPCYDAQHRGLAAAGGAEQHQRFAARDGEARGSSACVPSANVLPQFSMRTEAPCPTAVFTGPAPCRRISASQPEAG